MVLLVVIIVASYFIIICITGTSQVWADVWRGSNCPPGAPSLLHAPRMLCVCTNTPLHDPRLGYGCHDDGSGSITGWDQRKDESLFCHSPELVPDGPAARASGHSVFPISRSPCLSVFLPVCLPVCPSVLLCLCLLQSAGGSVSLLHWFHVQHKESPTCTAETCLSACLCLSVEAAARRENNVSERMGGWEGGLNDGGGAGCRLILFSLKGPAASQRRQSSHSVSNPEDRNIIHISKRNVNKIHRQTDHNVLTKPIHSKRKENCTTIHHSRTTYTTRTYTSYTTEAHNIPIRMNRKEQHWRQIDIQASRTDST